MTCTFSLCRFREVKLDLIPDALRLVLSVAIKVLRELLIHFVLVLPVEVRRIDWSALTDVEDTVTQLVEMRSFFQCRHVFNGWHLSVKRVLRQSELGDIGSLRLLRCLFLSEDLLD